MDRKETTKFLSRLLISKRLSGMGKYYASEVTFDYGHGKGKEKRVDFVQFEPENQLSVSGLEKGIFTSYEIKSCKADFKSGFGLNFETEKNYLVTTMETYKALTKEYKGQRFIPYNIGLLVAVPNGSKAYEEYENPTPIDTKCEFGWNLETIYPSHKVNRHRSMTEILFCMLRAGK